MRFTVQRSKVLVIGLAVALVAAACGGATQGGGAPGDATIGFASPADGSSVTIPFDVQLDASVPLGDPESGNHHAHLYFDSSTDSNDYDIVYGTSWQVTRALAPGEHTIIVALANPDHSLAGPTREVHVTVAGDGGEVAPTPSPSDGGLTY